MSWLYTVLKNYFLSFIANYVLSKLLFKSLFIKIAHLFIIVLKLIIVKFVDFFPIIKNLSRCVSISVSNDKDLFLSNCFTIQYTLLLILRKHLIKANLTKLDAL